MWTAQLPSDSLLTDAKSRRSKQLTIKYHNCSTANTQHFEYKKIPLYFKAQNLNVVFVHKHIFIQPDIGYTWKRKSKSKRTTSLCGANDMTVLNQLQIPTWQLSTLAAVGGLSIITCYDWPEEFFFFLSFKIIQKENSRLGSHYVCFLIKMLWNVILEMQVKKINWITEEKKKRFPEFCSQAATVCEAISPKCVQQQKQLKPAAVI